MRCFYLFVFLLGWSYRSDAQQSMFVYGGATADYVRAPSLLGDIRPKYGYQLALQIAVDAWLKPASLDATLQVAIQQQGYRQRWKGSTYRVNLNYFTISPGVAYRPNRFVTVNAGLDVNLLISARFKAVEDSTSIGVRDTYQSFGLAGRAEAVLWSHRIVSPYLGITHALLPALKYPRIDAAGNFNGNIRDIWYRTLCVGIRVKL